MSCVMIPGSVPAAKLYCTPLIETPIELLIRRPSGDVKPAGNEIGVNCNCAE